MSGAVLIRRAHPDDAAAVLAMWNGRMEWLVARDQLGQWGSELASERSDRRRLVGQWMAADGAWIAEFDGAMAGILVLVADAPDYAQATDQPETYLLFLLSAREAHGRGVGGDLVRHAVAQARAVGSERLRVDCWAGAPDLVAFYERRGFVRQHTFAVGDWHGQVFEMALG